MPRTNDLSSLTPLTPAVFHILLALTDGERHGYAIGQEVALQTDGSLDLGPGTLYGCLKRMLAAELLATIVGGVAAYLAAHDMAAPPLADQLQPNRQAGA